MTKKLLLPEYVRTLLQRRYANQQKSWLIGEGQWPLSVALGLPTEKDVTADPTGVRRWVQAWGDWSSGGSVSWMSRQWGRLGTQQLPASLALATPREVAAAVGDISRWEQVELRYQSITGRWPQLSGPAVVGKLFNVLAEYDDADFRRLFALLDWLERNPASGLMVRQLPVEGLDTKWLEKRKGLVADLVRQLRSDILEGDFYSVCGLRRQPNRARLRILCPMLRRSVGGLCDLEAPTEELATLNLVPSTVLIVENLETGLALPDLPGVVAFMGLGNAVSTLAQLPWIREARGIYWGDIDTHGFAILNAARGVMPAVASLLMDEHTLMAYRRLCVEEPVQSSLRELPLLTESERSVFEGLITGRWGPRLRLEQERIPWDYALWKIRTAAYPMGAVEGS